MTTGRGSKFLRVLGIILLSLTVLMTLMGAIGTTCVAFGAEKWGPRMAALIPVQPIFQALVVISIAAGIWGILATVRLARRRAHAYRDVMIFLVVAGLASAVQYYYSATLRGSTAPNNMRLYLTGLTFVVFVVFRLPPVWKYIGYEQGEAGGGGTRLAAGAALCLCSAIALSAPVWAGPTHVVDGFNTVEVLLPHLILAAALMGVGGVLLLVGPALKSAGLKRERQPALSQVN